MRSLIQIAVVLAIAAVASGNLPTILFHVKKAQLQLIQRTASVPSPRTHESSSGAWKIFRRTLELANTVNAVTMWLTSKPQSCERFILLVGQFFIEPPAESDQRYFERRKESWHQ